MKIRNGFVSNSSSSSFVIAVSNDCKSEDIKNALLNEDKALESFIKDEFQYVSENYDEFEGLEGEELKIAIAETVADEILNSFVVSDYGGKKYEYFMKLGGWKVTAEEYSNEGSNLTDLFVYQSLGEVDTEKFKIKSAGN